MNSPEINDGGPVFPSRPYKPFHHEPSLEELHYYSGLTLRDFFAAQIACGFSSNPYRSKNIRKNEISNEENSQLIARHSYEIADAMLAQRNKK